MAENNNADAIKARVRSLAVIDAMAELYLTCQAFNQYWSAANTDAAVPVTTDLVNDPANPDPARPITNNVLRQINTFATNFVTDFDANAKAKANAILSRNSNGRSRI